jgi:hypothetical protein
MEVSDQLDAPAVLSPEKPKYALGSKLVVPQSQSGCCGEKKNLALPEMELGPSIP